MRWFLPSAAVVLLAQAGRSQVVQAWSLPFDQSSLSDRLTDAIVDSAGNTYFTGSVRTSAGGVPWPVPSSSGLIARVGAQGVLGWSHAVTHAPDRATEFMDIAFDGSGGVVAGGATTSTNDYSIVDAFIARVDANGAVAWTRQYDSGGRSEIATALAVDPSGDVWVVGESWVLDAQNFLFLRYDSAGFLVFGRVWNAPGPGQVNSFAIAPDGQGGAFVTGRQRASNDSKLVVARINAAGNILWGRQVGSGTSCGYGLTVDTNGNVYVCGTLRELGLYDRFALLKYDASGNLLWQRFWGDGSHVIGVASKVALDPRGDVIVAGSWGQAAAEDILVQKLDALGNSIWSRSWSSTGQRRDLVLSLHVDGGGEIYVGGSSEQPLALRIDRDGTPVWSREFASPTNWDGVRGIGVGPLGSVFVATQISVPTDSDLLFVRLEETAVPFCFGDGSASACPCGNTSPTSERTGCVHSFGEGGRLNALGASSLSGDTLILQGHDMPDSNALYFQGPGAVGGGAGAPFGDGLLCAASPSVRLATRTNAAGSSRYPEVGDPPISVLGSVVVPGERTYQVWYRNAASFCTAATYNLTNGVRVTWVP